MLKMKTAKSYARGFLAMSKTHVKVYKFRCLKKYTLDEYSKTLRLLKKTPSHSRYYSR